MNRVACISLKLRCVFCECGLSCSCVVSVVKEDIEDIVYIPYVTLFN